LHEIFAKQQNYIEFYNQLSGDFLSQYKLSDKLIKTILDRKKKFSIDFIKKNLLNREVKIITVFDDDYPQDLLHISQTPFIIYVR
jgi:predicted Rossmann fold nucleotide-binding protein DprA/Smf involved in DNA uptake